MSAKPKRPNRDPSTSISTVSRPIKTHNPLRDGLGLYLANPTAHPSQVISVTPSFIVIRDLYPKSLIHLLILPRDPIKYHLHPFEAFDTTSSSSASDAASFLARCREEATRIKDLAASELRRKLGQFSALDQARNQALSSPDPESDLPPGRAWASEILVGVHAHPSMAHLHIHVISRDRFSACLRHRKHYNSFSTPFFVPLDDFPLAQDDPRRHPGREGYLKMDFVCWRCGRGFGNRFKELKAHLEEEFEEWKRI